MTILLQELIDKQDNFEVVRNQIAQILANEVSNQMSLATAAGKDPELWNLKIYTERAQPWEKWLNDQSDSTPIVNVWYDSSNFDKSLGDTVERQRSGTTYNIDIYALGVASNNSEGGHNTGDRESALNAQRGLRIVRNILMADTNAYLQLRGLVGTRWPDSIQAFQPELPENNLIQIWAVRLALNVEFNEFSPQYVPENLEIIDVTLQRDEDGKVLAELEIDFTL